MKLIEHLLRARIGMEPASIGLRHIQRAVRQGMASRGIANEDEYSSLLNQGAREWSDFIELIVVPETWFFRDRHPFISLTNLVRESWLPAHPRGVLKILSLPCSTGEEPYSASMALLDAEIDPFVSRRQPARPTEILHFSRRLFRRSGSRSANGFLSAGQYSG
jgi:chemotaxis protein methyltransferase WspC